jgi:hypothetical protein
MEKLAPLENETEWRRDSALFSLPAVAAKLLE